MQETPKTKRISPRKAIELLKIKKTKTSKLHEYQLEQAKKAFENAVSKIEKNTFEIA